MANYKWKIEDDVVRIYENERLIATIYEDRIVLVSTVLSKDEWEGINNIFNPHYYE